MTSLASDKLVVPEEKMADHEEQLSDEEKVSCRFLHDINSSGRPKYLNSMLHSTPCVRAGRRRPTLVNLKKTPGLSVTAAAQLLFLAQLPLLQLI